MKGILTLTILCIAFAGTTMAQDLEHTSQAASPKPAESAISGLVTDAELGEMVLMGLTGVPSQQDANTDRVLSSQRNLLNRNVTKALAVADGREDLRRAVKAFYIAYSTFLENITPSLSTPEWEARANAVRLKQEVDSKAAALRLEARLAGYNIPPPN